jgi:hypothetical protein
MRSNGPFSISIARICRQGNAGSPPVGSGEGRVPRITSFRGSTWISTFSRSTPARERGIAARWLGRGASAADHEFPGFDVDFDIFPIDAGKVDADLESVFIAIDVDLRLPRFRGRSEL